MYADYFEVNILNLFSISDEIVLCAFTKDDQRSTVTDKKSFSGNIRIRFYLISITNTLEYASKQLRITFILHKKQQPKFWN